MAAKPKRPREQARHDTELALLEAGASLLFEQPVNDLLGQVKAGPVAARAGRTTGALFHLWDDLDEFRAQLLDYVLSPERWSRQVPATVAAITDAIEKRGGVDLSDVTRAGAVANFEGLIGDPRMRLQMSLWSKYTDPAVAHRLKILYDGRTDQLIPMYQGLLNATNRRMKSPYGVRDFAVALTALAEGLMVRREVDPDSVPDDMPAPVEAEPSPEGLARWNLFAHLSFALVTAMTEPIPSE